MPGTPIGRGEGALVTAENEKAQGVRAESDQLKLELEASRLKFIHTELDLGHTFLQVALMTASMMVMETSTGSRRWHRPSTAKNGRTAPCLRSSFTASRIKNGPCTG